MSINRTKDVTKSLNPDALAVVEEIRRRHDEAPITAQDIAAVVDELRASCQRAGVPEDKIREIITKLQAGIGKPKSELAKLQTDAQTAATNAEAAAGMDAPDGRREEINRLRAEIRVLEKKIDAGIDAIADYLPKEKVKEWADRRERIDAMPAGEAKDEANHILNNDIKTHAKKAEKDAPPAVANILKDVVKNVDKTQDLFGELKNQKAASKKPDAEHDYLPEPSLADSAAPPPSITGGTSVSHGELSKLSSVPVPHGAKKDTQIG